MKATLERGVEFCRHIEPTLAGIGYHCALTGSVLYKGESEKDIDVMIYAHQKDVTKTPADILVHLTRVGVLNQYRTDPNYCDKDVFLCRWQGLRVDMIFVQSTFIQTSP